ncbi:MAG: response regulator transcription factor [Brumimicrobium sp.]|nr:response regulator transcription factor [Brumimicrobium sp.]
MTNKQEIASRKLPMECVLKIAIVEDDPDFRSGLERVISNESKFTLSGSFSSAESFLNEMDSISPDVVIMDINLPRMSGSECIAISKARNPEIQYIMCTVYEDEENLFKCFRVGATGYLLKKTPPAAIVEAIIDVVNGGSPMSASIARKVVTALHTGNKLVDSTVLTPRENEIVFLLADGFRYKEIANKLFISLDTVRSHIRHIYEKLQVNSRLEAINKVRRI